MTSNNFWTTNTTSKTLAHLNTFLDLRLQGLQRYKPLPKKIHYESLTTSKTHALQPTLTPMDPSLKLDNDNDSTLHDPIHLQKSHW